MIRCQGDALRSCMARLVVKIRALQPAEQSILGQSFGTLARNQISPFVYCARSISWLLILFVSISKSIKQRINQVITNDAGYPESFFHSNIKLVLMTLACAVGAFTQFYPASEPNSRSVYLWGGVVFTCITVVIQMLYFVVDGDYILFTLPKGGAGDVKLKLRSKMPNYSVS
jgi:hypothetical protein